MFTLPPLPYAHSDLEPYIDEQTMKLHYGKHHQAYVDNLNDALITSDVDFNGTIVELLQMIDTIPEKHRVRVHNNAGGHANHSLFWECMTPKIHQEPKGKLLTALNTTFGSYELFKEKFTSLGLSRFGSGWIWLTIKKNRLELFDTANQDSPYMHKDNIPLLCLDVWEHAYYLKYQNRRAEYINAWWNVVNWEMIANTFEKIPS